MPLSRGAVFVHFHRQWPSGESHHMSSLSLLSLHGLKLVIRALGWHRLCLHYGIMDSPTPRNQLSGGQLTAGSLCWMCAAMLRLVRFGRVRAPAVSSSTYRAAPPPPRRGRVRRCGTPERRHLVSQYSNHSGSTLCRTVWGGVLLTSIGRAQPQTDPLDGGKVSGCIALCSWITPVEPRCFRTNATPWSGASWRNGRRCRAGRWRHGKAWRQRVWTWQTKQQRGGLVQCMVYL
mmetsp:Transcript_63934/g.139097  ORF Transcript_63934/g.139097 Transcript_63934/m.139097 type:complete len:233 (-) Transcript_63934:193-891(-)